MEWSFWWGQMPKASCCMPARSLIHSTIVSACYSGFLMCSLVQTTSHLPFLHVFGSGGSQEGFLCEIWRLGVKQQSFCLVVYLPAHLTGMKHWPGPYLPSLPLSPPLASLTPGQWWAFALMMTGTFVWLVSSVTSGALYSSLQKTQFWHIWHCMLSTLLYLVFPL